MCVCVCVCVCVWGGGGGGGELITFSSQSSTYVVLSLRKTYASLIVETHKSIAVKNHFYEILNLG